MIGFCPLASGSKGNSVFLGTENSKILIDAGLSGKATKARLAEIGVDIADLDAILITHEHGDHVKGLRIMAYRMGIPVFANSDTARSICDMFSAVAKFTIFTTGDTFEFRDLEIHPFSIQHDTVDPVGFTITTNDIKIGFCTDLGFASSLVKNRLQNCDYLYIEANHDPDMVHASPRPFIYKQRVLSRSGHLSNEACGNLLLDVYHEDLKHVHLAHLSDECNSPEKALTTINEILGEKTSTFDISIAYQNSISNACGALPHTTQKVLCTS
ncbi:MAG: MBL fold metallo-hydrolase [Waddliaceae bacterium]|jgi:phosphoribosyl 1,2-cyclic phosphodiesterase|nr:MBL fold metallo-hydrolase [Waddliaceae bacterium]MBT3579191.1 MBL fold metallo-hydrolase [Waddliaceae bacterium]MBT4444749.1 MBL fold metallo-hydrolase [Waddliaceae bacterium]MBT6928891.1 MBL fold metallo-hydrolase [Waddliaceae bacterium]MBT7264138.1 MBL fold metallo-hydrolase [Waddliaceae bacterium]